MEAERAQMLRRVDYLLRQIHLGAGDRREEFTEVIYLRTHMRITPSAFRVVDSLRWKAMRLSDLATELRELLPTVLRLVQQLEAKGLVEQLAMRPMPVSRSFNSPRSASSWSIRCGWRGKITSLPASIAGPTTG